MGSCETNPDKCEALSDQPAVVSVREVICDLCVPAGLTDQHTFVACLPVALGVSLADAASSYSRGVAGRHCLCDNRDEEFFEAAAVRRDNPIQAFRGGVSECQNNDDHDSARTLFPISKTNVL